MTIPKEFEKFRPKPFFFLDTHRPEDLTFEAIDRQMAQLKADGFGGPILFNIPDLGWGNESYLTDKWFQMTENYLLAAQKNGLKLWFSDGWRCPPGDVGDKIKKINPNLKQHRLARNAQGEAEVVDVPWGFPAFEEPESSRLFIELVYEAYAKHLGKYFGNTLEGIFSDADNRRFDAFTLTEMEGNYFPWSSNFEETFRAAFGYDIKPYLKDVVNNVFNQQTFDYYKCCELLYNKWFENNYNWCKAHNLKYTFHTSDTGPFPRLCCRRSSVFTEGVPFTFYKCSDFPGTDHEILALDGGTHFDSRLFVPKVAFAKDKGAPRVHSFANTKYDLRAKQVSSVAYHYGKEGAMCEMFAATNLGVLPSELRQIAAWQILQGITFVVPHGITARFWGPCKYGAPPEQHHATGGSIREVTDFIAKYVGIATTGVFDPSVKVMDISDAVLRGAQYTDVFFEFTDRLNHAGISYVIVPEGTPGAIDVLGSAKQDVECGMVAVSATPELPPRDFEFTGGDLLAMRRKLPDGTRFLLVCNLWSDHEVSGALTFEGRTVELELASGEIAVIGGPYEEFRAPFRPAKREYLPFPAKVQFAEPNRIPLHYNSEFEAMEELSGIFLQVPEEYVGDGVFLDGKALTGTKCTVFEDEYISYDLGTLTRGKHSIDIATWRNRPKDLGTPQATTGNVSEKAVDHKFYMPAYLTGEFDVDVKTKDDFNYRMYADYNLQIWYPAEWSFHLTKRRATLERGSWAVQGQPFYSGAATYTFEYSGAVKNAVLEVPDARVRVAVTVDGKPCGETGFRPYRFPLGDLKDGTHVIQVKVTNTIANRLEEYAAPSGLVNGIVIASC